MTQRELRCHNRPTIPITNVNRYRRQKSPPPHSSAYRLGLKYRINSSSSALFFSSSRMLNKTKKKTRDTGSKDKVLFVSLFISTRRENDILPQGEVDEY